MKIAFKQVRGKSGTDVWTDSLSAALRKQGAECIVIYYSTYYGFFPQLLMGQSLGKKPVDITHCNTWNGFAFKDDNPLVLTEHHVIHDSILEPFKSVGQKAFHKLIYRYEVRSLEMADIVTCVSQYTKMMLEKTFGYSDAEVIYNGVDPEVFQPLEIDRNTLCRRFGLTGDEKILLFAGNPSRRKGADLLPEIMGRLDDSYILLMTTGLSDTAFSGCRIHNVGKVTQEELVLLYNLCDVLLFPSRLEGFGLTVAEAMACGKPVIATNGSSLPELVVDGKGGYLCEMDDINDFSQKIELLYDDFSLMHRMGNYNRQRVYERFTLDQMAQQYLFTYQKLV